MPPCRMRLAAPSSSLLLSVSLAACGGSRGGGPGTGWEGAPAPRPEEEIATAVLTELAGGSIRGLEPVGPPVGRELEEGGFFTHRLMWEPGRCYAAVAGALGGVEELELWIIASGPGLWPGKVVAGDEGKGNLAIAGGDGRCFRPGDDTPEGAFAVKAARGGGFAAVQLYATPAAR